MKVTLRMAIDVNSYRVGHNRKVQEQKSDDSKENHSESVNYQDPEKYKKERYDNLRRRIDLYKPTWDKNGVIQYKTHYSVF